MRAILIFQSTYFLNHKVDRRCILRTFERRGQQSFNCGWLALRSDATVLVESDCVVTIHHEMCVVCDEHDRGTAFTENPTNTLGHQVSSHLCIDRRQHVVQQHNAGTRVASAAESYARFLAAGEIHSTLAYFGLVSCR